MRDMRNPFRLQTAERIETEVDFLRLLSPAVLDLLPDDVLNGIPVFIRSAQGGGKTSLLQLFTLPILKRLNLLKDSDPYRETYNKLKELGVIDESGIKIISIMLTSRRTFPSLSDLSISTSGLNRLFLALLDARIIMGSIRSAISVSNLRFPDDLHRITITPLLDEPPVPDLLLPCNGERAYSWAENVEREVGLAIDSLSPLDSCGIPGHDCLYSLRLFDNKSIMVDDKIITGRWLVLLDDIHKLTISQRQTLKNTLLDQRSSTSIWLAERYEALSIDELLSNGALEGRDYNRVIKIEDSWRRRQVFESAAIVIAERRTQVAADVVAGAWPIGSFAASINSTINFDEEFPQLSSYLKTVKDRVFSLASEYPKYKLWVESRMNYPGTLYDQLVEWRMMEILIERDRRKSQMVFDFDLSIETLDDREDSSIKAAAILFISTEFNLPYYYGTQTLANLGFYNIEQFLRLGGDLFEESLGASILRQSPILAPSRQEKIILKAADSRIGDLPKRAPNGRDVLNFINAVGIFCKQETYQPNAPYSPGVTGIAIPMSDRDKLLDRSFLIHNASFQRFSKMLKTALSQNIFLPILDYKVKGNQYMVLYLNRIICPKYRLPLRYGGLREKPIETFINWLEKGYQPIKDKELPL